MMGSQSGVIFFAHICITGHPTEHVLSVWKLFMKECIHRVLPWGGGAYWDNHFHCPDLKTNHFFPMFYSKTIEKNEV